MATVLCNSRGRHGATGRGKPAQGLVASLNPLVPWVSCVVGVSHRPRFLALVSPPEPVHWCFQLRLFSHLWSQCLPVFPRQTALESIISAVAF